MKTNRIYPSPHYTKFRDDHIDVIQALIYHGPVGTVLDMKCEECMWGSMLAQYSTHYIGITDDDRYRYVGGQSLRSQNISHEFVSSNEYVSCDTILLHDCVSDDTHGARIVVGRRNGKRMVHCVIPGYNVAWFNDTYYILKHYQTVGRVLFYGPCEQETEEDLDKYDVVIITNNMCSVFDFSRVSSCTKVWLFANGYYSKRYRKNILKHLHKFDRLLLSSKQSTQRLYKDVDAKDKLIYIPKDFKEVKGVPLGLSRVIHYLDHIKFDSFNIVGISFYDKSVGYVKGYQVMTEPGDRCVNVNVHNVESNMDYARRFANKYDGVNIPYLTANHSIHSSSSSESSSHSSVHSSANLEFLQETVGSVMDFLQQQHPELSDT